MSYPGDGPAGLTDGMIASRDYLDPAWLGFWENDLVATIDLEQATSITELRARFLQDVPLGIFFPREVEFLAGDAPATLQWMKSVPSPVPPREAGPLTEVFVAKELNVRARYVRVHARNLARIPGWHPAAGQKAWLFADEIMVNPSPRGMTGEKHPKGKGSNQ